MIVKRGLAYTAFLARQRRALRRRCASWPASCSPSDADEHNWIIAALATLVVVLLAQPVKEAVQNALDRALLSRSLRLPPRAGRLRARSEQRPRRRAAQPAAGRAHRRDAGRRSHGADARRRAVAATSRRSATSASRATVPRLLARLVVACRGSTPATPSRSTIRLPPPASSAEEVEFWRDAGIYYFVPCVFEGARDRRARARPQGHRRAVQQRGPRAADRRRRPGGDRDRERPPLPPAAPQGRRARPACASSTRTSSSRSTTAWWCSTPTSGSSAGTARSKSSTASRATRRSAAGSATCSTRRSSRRCAPARARHPDGATLFRVPLVGARRRRGRACWSTSTAVPLQNAAGRRRGGRGTMLLIEDITDRVQLEEQLQISEKMASIGLLAAGVAHEVNTPLTGISSFTQMLLEGADPADPRTRAAREDRAADVPRRQDRQRPAEPVASRARRLTSGPTVDLNAVITDVFSLLEHQFEVGSIKVRRELRAGAGAGARHRAPAAAGVPEPVPQRARRDAERRLAVGDDARRRRPRRSPKSPTPAPAFRPSSSRASTIRSSPPRRSAAAPASACRSPTASCASTTARSAATAPSGRARASR